MSEETEFNPGPDAKAEPYWAIMQGEEDGPADGNSLWSFGNRIMLFFDKDIGAQLVSSFSKGSKTRYVLRGVSAGHLEAIQELVKGSDLEIYVALEIRGRQIEAIPLAEHLEELPPDLPPPG